LPRMLTSHGYHGKALFFKAAATHYSQPVALQIYKCMETQRKHTNGGQGRNLCCALDKLFRAATTSWLTFKIITSKPAVDGWCAVYPFPVYSVMLWWLGRWWCGRLCVTEKWLETEDSGLFLPDVPLPGLALSQLPILQQ
jgi:hypothetical protein